MILHRKGKKKRGKAVSCSSIEMFRIELSADHLNPQGIFFGGSLLQLVESYAEKVAKSHAENPCKTKGIDFVRFFSPVRKKDLLFCSISVNRTWDSELEIGVQIIADDFRLLEKKRVLTAYFIFKAIDDEGEPVDIAHVIPETKKQIERYLSAEKRRQMRLKNSNKVQFFNN